MSSCKLWRWHCGPAHRRHWRSFISRYKSQRWHSSGIWENYTSRHHNGSHTFFRTYTGHARERPYADDELAPGSHTGDTMDPLQHYFLTVNKHLECIWKQSQPWTLLQLEAFLVLHNDTEYAHKGFPLSSLNTSILKRKKTKQTTI